MRGKCSWSVDADSAPSFIEASAPTDHELPSLLQTIIARLVKMLTRRGVLAPNAKLRALVVPQGPEVQEQATSVAVADACEVEPVTAAVEALEALVDDDDIDVADASVQALTAIRGTTH